MVIPQFSERGEQPRLCPREQNKTGGRGRRSGVTRGVLVRIVAALQGWTIVIILVFIVRCVAGI